MANFPDPDSWVRDSTEFGARMFQILSNGNILAAQGKAVLTSGTGTVDGNGKEQSLADLLAAQVGLSQQILARLNEILGKLNSQ